MAGLTPQQKIDLITDQLQEVLRPEILEDVIVKQSRPLVVYWGTATTGRPHYVHGFLDNEKAPIELVEFRAEYYRLVIRSLFKAIGISLDQLEFVLGSSYQTAGKYRMDLLKLTTKVSVHDTQKAGAEVVKQTENPPLSGLIYPLMQALGEEYLGVDAQFGGLDQRKIFTLAGEFLPRIGYKERAHLMNPMVPGLAGGKMSASDPDSKIDLLDTAEAVKKKLKKAFAVPKEVEGNGIISFVEYVLLPVSGLNSKDGKGKFVIERRDEEPIIYTDMETLKEDYRADRLTPQSLKAGVTNALTKLLAPIQKEFQESLEWQEIERKAYPPAEPEKKKKKVKDKGTRHPVAAAAAAAATNVNGVVEKMEVVETGKKPEESDVVKGRRLSVQPKPVE